MLEIFSEALGDGSLHPVSAGPLTGIDHDVDVVVVDGQTLELVPGLLDVGDVDDNVGEDDATDTDSDDDDGEGDGEDDMRMRIWWWWR